MIRVGSFNYYVPLSILLSKRCRRLEGAFYVLDLMLKASW
jgi:hypothetical protein